MNPEIKQLWIDALRSDQYIQGNNYLKYDLEGTTYHCCLGVLCDVYQKQTGKSIETTSRISRTDSFPKEVYLLDGRSAFLPIAVRLWADLDCSDPVIGTIEEQKNATSWNDNKKATFNEIANLIDACL